MIVVEHQVATQTAPERDTPYNVIMKVWARWMTLTDRQEPGGWGHPQDIKEFMRTGESVDTMINDLPRVQWWAVRKAHGIATVWRFPELSFADALTEAEEKLSAKMLACVDTRRYFS